MVKDSTISPNFPELVELESIYIRNMVCRRCLLATEKIFEMAGIMPFEVALGDVRVATNTIDLEKLHKLDLLLKDLGLERVQDPKGRLVENLKLLVIRTVHHEDLSCLKFKWSRYIEQEMGYDYDYLSKLFSARHEITLERYIIRQKIEKVKELLINNHFSLKEIAVRMGYKNTTHISSQFKLVTGVTITSFRKGPSRIHRVALDLIT